MVNFLGPVVVCEKVTYFAFVCDSKNLASPSSLWTKFVSSGNMHEEFCTEGMNCVTQKQEYLTVITGH